MPRNEFKAGDEEHEDLSQQHPDEEDLGIDMIFYVDDRPYAAVYKFSPGKEKSEASDHEIDPVEDDPQSHPVETRPTLAELRKSSRSTTAAHFARPAT